MRVFAALAAASFSFLVIPAIAQAAEPAKLCVRASRPSQYNVRAIGPHDLWIANAVGDRTPVRLTTTCIHIWAGAFVAVHSDFQCVGMGDQVTVQDMARRPESCRVSKVTAFVPGSEAEGYR
jgi:hypothetical protein